MNSGGLSWVLVAQFALPFFVLSIILIVVLVRGRKKYKEAARQLIVQVKSNEKKQKEQLIKFLTDSLAISKSQAKKSTKKIINERKFLIRNLVSGLLDKNTEALVGIEDDLSRLVDHYHKLEVELGAAPKEKDVEELPEPKPVDTEQSIEQTPNEDSQLVIKGLKKEIKELKHEVHITLTTLNNIFGEFSSMFGEKVKDNEMSVDQIITAMQTFSNKRAAENKSETDDLDGETAESETEQLEASEPEEPETSAEPEPESLVEADLEQSNTKVEGLIEESIGDDLSFSEEEVVVVETSTKEEGSETAEAKAEQTKSQDSLDSLDDVLDKTDDISTDEDLEDIDSVLDELELDDYPDDDEPSWDEAFDESGDKKDDEPSWDEAFDESGDKKDDEPSWDEAFDESGDKK